MTLMSPFMQTLLLQYSVSYVALTSADNGISQLAAKGLHLLAHAERQPNAPVNTVISEEDKSKRNPTYEQLGNPRITFVGMLSFTTCGIYFLNDLLSRTSRPSEKDP